jgi:hypothetical protein
MFRGPRTVVNRCLIRPLVCYSASGLLGLDVALAGVRNQESNSGLLVVTRSGPTVIFVLYSPPSRHRSRWRMGGVVLVVVKIRRQEFAGAVMGQSFELRRRMSLKCLYTASAGGFSPSG